VLAMPIVAGLVVAVGVILLRNSTCRRLVADMTMGGTRMRFGRTGLRQTELSTQCRGPTSHGNGQAEH
jgi:hypothetical protein